MPSLVVTLVGPDRPGLVGAVSDVVRKHGGNWMESRMSHLGGQFAGIVLIEMQEAPDAMLASLKALDQQGLTVVATVDTGTSTEPEGTSVLTLNLVGNDRPGIVREISQILASSSVNVEELETECSDAPMSGGRIFKATARLKLPADLSEEALQHALERIAADLMIEFSLE